MKSEEVSYRFAMILKITAHNMRKFWVQYSKESPSEIFLKIPKKALDFFQILRIISNVPSK